MAQNARKGGMAAALSTSMTTLDGPRCSTAAISPNGSATKGIWSVKDGAIFGESTCVKPTGTVYIDCINLGLMSLDVKGT